MDDDLETFFSFFKARFLLLVITDEEDTRIPGFLVIVLFEAIGPNVTIEDIDIVLRD